MTIEKANVSPGSSATDGPRPKAGPADIVKDVKRSRARPPDRLKEVAEDQISVRKDKALDTLGNVARRCARPAAASAPRRRPRRRTT